MKQIHSRGFGIITALFILVVLAGLGGYVLNMSNAQQIGSAQDIQGVRALQAARAGIEWGLYRVQRGGAGCPAATSELTLPATATTLSDFTVTVVCQASGSPAVYTLVSTACSQPNAASPKCPNVTAFSSMYVERQLEVTFSVLESNQE